MQCKRCRFVLSPKGNKIKQKSCSYASSILLPDHCQRDVSVVSASLSFHLCTQMERHTVGLHTVGLHAAKCIIKSLSGGKVLLTHLV